MNGQRRLVDATVEGPVSFLPFPDKVLHEVIYDEFVYPAVLRMHPPAWLSFHFLFFFSRRV